MGPMGIGSLLTISSTTWRLCLPIPFLPGRSVVYHLFGGPSPFYHCIPTCHLPGHLEEGPGTPPLPAISRSLQSGFPGITFGNWVTVSTAVQTCWVSLPFLDFVPATATGAVSRALEQTCHHWGVRCRTCLCMPPPQWSHLRDSSTVSEKISLRVPAPPADTGYHLYAISFGLSGLGGDLPTTCSVGEGDFISTTWEEFWRITCLPATYLPVSTISFRWGCWILGFTCR